MQHKIIRYMEHREHGWGWWEQPKGFGPIHYGSRLEDVIENLCDQYGWEVAAFAAIPGSGGQVQTLILKRAR